MASCTYSPRCRIEPAWEQASEKADAAAAFLTDAMGSDYLAGEISLWHRLVGLKEVLNMFTMGSLGEGCA